MFGKIFPKMTSLWRPITFLKVLKYPECYGSPLTRLQEIDENDDFPVVGFCRWSLSWSVYIDARFFPGPWLKFVFCSGCLGSLHLIIVTIYLNLILGTTSKNSNQGYKFWKMHEYMPILFALKAFDKWMGNISPSF